LTQTYYCTVILFHCQRETVSGIDTMIHTFGTSFSSFVACILLLLSKVFVNSFDSKPSNSRHQTTLHAYSVSTTEGAEDRRRQSRKQHDPLISLNLNLDAMAQSAAAPVAQEMLQRIRALHQEGYYDVSPDTVSYNSVLKAWKEDNNPEKAHEYLQQMLELDEMIADVISFNTVILAFAKKGNYTKAVQIIRQMEERDDLSDPDTLTYNALLYALAQSKDQGTTKKAEQLLREMIGGRHNVTVDTTSFNTVIYAWSQIANKSTPAAAHRAQQLLNHMEELALAGNTTVCPDIYTYTTVIQAWANCEQSLKSQKILDAMTSKGLLPNRFTYTAVMSSLAKTGMAEEAETLLNRMMLAYKQGDKSLKPDTVAFSSVMDGWARLSHVDKPYAADRALSLLDRMKCLEREGMGPNARTYTSVLSAVAKSGTWEACEKARELLRDMEYEYEEGSKWLQPSVIHYNAVLHAYARSPRADKALRASSFLQTMKNHPNPKCHPDTISYNSVLMACANAFGNEELKRRSYMIAKDIFKATILEEDNIRPTSTTFVHFCKASRRLILNDKPLRMTALQKSLRLCCRKGMLNHVVVLQAQLSCKTDEEWRNIAGEVSDHVGKNGKLLNSKVPKEWICNAGR
jgi:pentatricopeptide repeat protein